MKYDAACLVNLPTVVIVCRIIGLDHKNIIENDYRSGSTMSRENYYRREIHFLKLNVVYNMHALMYTVCVYSPVIVIVTQDYNEQPHVTKYFALVFVRTARFDNNV